MGNGLSHQLERALPEQVKPVAPEQREVLLFEVAGQRFGLPARAVRELLRAVFINALPRTAAGVEGVINVRGEVMPVVDIRQRLGLPRKPVEPADHFVVVWVGERLLALRVDRAVELATPEADAVDKADAMPGAAAGFRVARFPHGLVVVLDVEALLAQGASAELMGASALTLPSSRSEPDGREGKGQP